MALVSLTYNLMRGYTMKIYLGNAFSGNMVIGHAMIEKDDLSEDTAQALAERAQSCIGHAQTANILSKRWGFPVACNRTNIRLEAGDILITASANQRLPEGATELPPGVELVFQRWIVKSN